ncbi:fatty acyl-CoA reductase wat-like isoform X2 [Vespula squamosa]|uniref:Fatty acyl-CoA reductase wat-like isoform X2 n=1 Tax=Vespula squamosa TaxID=30214 RepID=A0ABD2BIE7_VESSQ
MDHEVSEFNVVSYNGFVKMTDEANPKHYLEMFTDRFLEVETMDVPLKESEQEVAFENVNNLTLIQKFYYGQSIFMIQ